MASIIEGYNYDIFVSYRQKDNKYDGWVTEFVDNLKRELESMFKEEVSVYFDINPSDYLLESYDVDASLKDKLKCLIFIPIVSRTYCDPKSFAWDHEFKAFIELASQDRFGLKITLPNSNVTNRVLPIRINDLDVSDIKLCESTLGSVLRGIDFIYKEPGVNRPLRSNEDNPHDNLNRSIYRNQINKVALIIRDIVESMKILSTSDGEKEFKERESIQSKEVISGGSSLFDKEAIKKEILSDKSETTREKKPHIIFRKPLILVPGILLIISLFAAMIILMNKDSKIRLALNTTIPEIEKYVSERNYFAAYNLLMKSEKYISKSPTYQDLVSRVTTKMTILSDPPGADVYIREYSDSTGEWKNLGKTPIDSTRMPNVSYYTTGFTAFTVKFKKEGFEDVIAVTLTKPDTLFRRLFRIDSIPPGMVYVEGYAEEEANNFLKVKHGFFLDKYEVTNKQYKEFLDKGGYSSSKYWKEEFIKNGKPLTWEEAIAEFTDKTGRPGPATWEAGDYPDGQDDNPVSGVSWYEAAAYAESIERNLPSSNHWSSGAGFYIRFISPYFNSQIIPASNFNDRGPEKVGKSRGINCFGAFDMAGNVREWCSNDTKVGRIVRGGAWDDASYMYGNLSQIPPFDRSPKNGFRCVKYIDKEKIPALAFQQITFSEPRNFYNESPVSHDIFRIYRNQFQYDKKPLNSKIEGKYEAPEDYYIEKITYDAAYGNERGIAYLFLPKGTEPPFQTVIFFPGTATQREDDLVASEYATWYVHFLVKTGRAVIFPVYLGTFERKIPLDFNTLSHQATEYTINLVKDLCRSIDYLETRQDIDTSKLGYIGVSWGGQMGPIIAAVENRLGLSILIKGGIPVTQYNPEVDRVNYISRVKIPVLMLNGEYDATFPFETNVKPLYDLLGTPEQDKRLCTYKSDHNIPRDDMIRETLNWLDKYFGPVK
jgi:dienelactone hydrolase